MWLIDWLLARVNNVLDWFGDAYWYLRNLVYSIPNTITDIENTIYNYYVLAHNYVISHVTDFYNTHIHPLLVGLADDMAGLFDWVSNRIDELQTQIDNIPTITVDWIYQAIDDIRNLIANNLDWLWSYIEPILNYDIPYLNASINDIINEQANLRDWVINQINPDIQEFMIWYNKAKATLVSFIDYPAGFMLELFWSIFLNFLCFLIGYGLGTTKYDLPTKPNWNKKG